VTTHARTPQEQREVDADIGEYLAAAGAPPRPPGYRWYLRLPPGYDPERFWDTLNAALAAAEPAPVHPRDIARHLATLVPALYDPQDR